MSIDTSHETQELTLEDLPRKDFQFTTWEGFAVSLEELHLTEHLIQDENLRGQVIKLAQNGFVMCDENGEIDVSLLDSTQLLGTRVDGIGFFLQAILAGKYPPVRNGERVRSMTEEEGVLFTALAQIAIDGQNRITGIQNLTREEIMEMIKSGKVYGLDAALIDAVYPLLFPEVRSSEQFMTLLTYPLRKGDGISDRDKLAFQYKGEALWEYLTLIAKQRSGIRWGVNRTITQDNSYRFDKGHVAQREIQIQNQDGVIPTRDMSFLITKPNTLEHKIIDVCQQKPIQK